MKKLIASAVVVAGLSLVGCQNREAKTEKQAPAAQQNQGTGGGGTAGQDQGTPNPDEVNPHAMGGLGSKESVPPAKESVGEGSDSKFKQPTLENENEENEQLKQSEQQQDTPANNR